MESDFKKNILHHSDLAGGYFLGSVFDEADLSDSMISRAIFEYASMKHCIMRHCTAIKASFYVTLNRIMYMNGVLNIGMLESEKRPRGLLCGPSV
ncbi:pentapeptide repeat-containing protein [Paenibacillus sp. FSL R7-269]|uniref:pentapeptide repeat-containing protein n=1 Tax=unclassified Paenibacillus TaxID=185978 RepID=UPI003FA3A387